VTELEVISWNIFFTTTNQSAIWTSANRDRRGRNRMVVGFTTTCAISAYHH